ncbi:MAG: hypothetical protein K9N07_07385 [Candidatus Cloacimonetes bacterium]|nr:hypothetical protein [Candidatus Cloacimonadota bacterium]
MSLKSEVMFLVWDIIFDKYKMLAKSFYEEVEIDFSFIISPMGNHESYHGVIDYIYSEYQS